MNKLLPFQRKYFILLLAALFLFSLPLHAARAAPIQPFEPWSGIANSFHLPPMNLAGVSRARPPSAQAARAPVGGHKHLARNNILERTQIQSGSTLGTLTNAYVATGEVGYKTIRNILSGYSWLVELSGAGAYQAAAAAYDFIASTHAPKISLPTHAPAANAAAPPARAVAATITPRAAPPIPLPRILNSYPTYTTIVKGVSQETLNQSFAALRTSILGTVAGMLVPPAQQYVPYSTFSNSLAAMGRIEDLSNLIVRNGDFRGGTFSGGSADKCWRHIHRPGRDRARYCRWRLDYTYNSIRLGQHRARRPLPVDLLGDRRGGEHRKRLARGDGFGGTSCGYYDNTMKKDFDRHTWVVS